MARVIRWDTREVVIRRVEYSIPSPCDAVELSEMLDAATREARSRQPETLGEVLIESTTDAVVVVVQRTEVLSGAHSTT